MSIFNEYAAWRDIQYTSLTPEEIKAAADAARGVGGGSTSSPAATGTPKPQDRTPRENYLVNSSDSRLATMLAKGLVTEEELQALVPNRIASIKDNPVTASELAESFPNLPPAPPPPPPAPPGPADLSGYQFPTAQAATGVTSSASAAPGTLNLPSATAAQGVTSGAGPAVAQAGGSAGSGSVGPDGRTVDQIRGTEYRSDAERAWYLQQTGGAPTSGGTTSRASSGGSSGGGTSSRASGGGGGGAGPSSAAAPVPPPPVPNSPADLAARGAMAVGSRGLLNGQQYLRGAGAVQLDDGLWYVVQNGQPTGPGFKSQAAANKATPMTQAGPALTSRMGNSPTARAASVGGFQNTINPNNALFDLIPLDQSIAAGATKGAQQGDILGTSVRQGFPSLDITLGGISEGGGLMPVGNPIDPYASFTGQLPGNVSIGESSILGNSMHDTLYSLQQSTGIPISTLAKLDLTPEKALQLEQAQATLRGQGLMPDLASLYAQNEPAAGGINLKVGSANGGSSNTDFDRALSSFLDYADISKPDLTYFPDPSVTDDVGNGLDAWGAPVTYAHGGQFMTSGPLGMVDLGTGKLMGLAGEAGYDEKVTIDPMGRDVRLGREQAMKGGWQGPQRFAQGGTIYAGVNKGFQTPNPIRDDAGMVTPYGQAEGYKSDPYIGGGGGSAIARGNGVDIVRDPSTSATGQPVPASFELMSPSQKQPFQNQGNRVGTNRQIQGPISPSSEMYFNGDSYLPVYTQEQPKDYTYLGDPLGYDYVPYNAGGTPAVVKVPRYDTGPHIGKDQRNARDIAILQAALNGGSTGNMARGNLSFSQMPTDRNGLLAMLYDLDPKAAMLAAAQGGNGHGGMGGMGGGFGGMGGGGWRQSSRDIQNEAFRQRYYGIDARNRARAGMDPATILDIPRMQWNGEGEPPWGTGEAPYQRFNGTVPEGYVLPFDYEPGSPWFNRDNQPGGFGGFGGGFGGFGGHHGGGFGFPGRGGYDGPQIPENNLPFGGRTFPRYGGWRGRPRMMQGAA